MHRQEDIPLELTTERPDVALKELSTPDDDRAYFDAVDASRDHLSQFGDPTAAKYPTVADVESARLNAGNKLRMGIWHDETFVGSINATPNVDDDSVEIGYWLDKRQTGHGYATVAVRALVNYAVRHFAHIYADVVDGNEDSVNVLRRAGFRQVQSREVGHLAFELIRQSQLRP